MSDYDDMDDERAARIDEGIDQVHRFMRNVIDDPTPLQLIPDGSTVRFRTVLVDNEEVQLTAHRLTDSSGPWTARVTSCEPVERPDAARNGRQMSRCAEHRHQLVRVAPTAQAALDAVEAVVLSTAAEAAGR